MTTADMAAELRRAATTYTIDPSAGRLVQLLIDAADMLDERDAGDVVETFRCEECGRTLTRRVEDSRAR